MELKTIIYKVADFIATITLSRPKRRNAWTGRMHTDYRWVLEQADKDPAVRVIVVTGDPEGGAFCAGMDLKEAARIRAEEGVDVLSKLKDPFHEGMREVRKPIIAALNGDLPAGGLMLAVNADLRIGLLAAALMLLASCLSTFFSPIRSGEDLNLQPSRHWPDPDEKMYVEPDQGPVLVTVEYKVRLDQAEDFRNAMKALKEQRLQNGVLRWGLFVDIENPELYREVYLEETWEAHLRHHDRVTRYEMEIAAKAYAYHVGEAMPEVQHLLLCEEL